MGGGHRRRQRSRSRETAVDSDCDAHNIVYYGGHSDEEECLVPTPVKALVGKAVTAVATGSYHTVVMLANGELQAFGSNEYGQLGAAKEGGPEPVGVSLPRI